MKSLREKFGPIDIYLFDQLLRGRIAPGMRIVDAGCGDGRNLVYLLRQGYEVFAADMDPRAVATVRAMAPHLPADNFRAEPLEAMSFPAGFADAVISSAVLHFARDDEHFDAMLQGTWRVLKPGGLFFCRLASSIGIESQVQPLAGRRCLLPDGSERYLVDEKLLAQKTEQLGGRMADPLKTTVVQNQRSMTTWVLWKAALTLALTVSAFAAEYRVDPFWPKPLPAPKDAAGVPHQWITGETGGTCTDANDHVFSINRAGEPGRLGGLLAYEGTTSIPSPPVIEFDAEGKVANSWGDPSLPAGLHGCFVDYEGNIWIAGSADGIVQKWTHDGKKLLLQIGQKGVCDGGKCASPGANQSHTLLDLPADMAVDPAPDPVTGQPGSIYIADGYGNHRIAVFDAKGTWLRQWGEAGSGPGQFAPNGGGHPHCVLLGNDGLVYVCDRNQNRIEIFDKLGRLQRMISVDPPDHLQSAMRVCDLAFSTDPEQSTIFVDDVGTEVIWMVERKTGKLLGGFGHAGHQAGEFTGAHTIATDSRGNVFVGEAGGGRRTQKFAPLQ